MTADEVRESLSSSDVISEISFVLVREICGFYNSGNESLARELVLRALEFRDFFREWASVLDDLVREVGLFPYLEESRLSLVDSIAYEFHRPIGLEEPIVFHREQAEIYRRLLDGDNIILSAPTSFGKSKVIDALIASQNYRNVVVVVPTIALIDETRRRLSRFSEVFKIITQVSQGPAERNVFVFTPERVNAYGQFPAIDFFVIDEFYKIGDVAKDPKRTVALNNAFYRLAKGGGQFYLLGPCVKEIPEGLESRFRCHFFSTNFATVACDIYKVDGRGDDLEALKSLLLTIRGEPTLIFCKSPKSTNDIALALLEDEITERVQYLDEAANWMEENFHPSWVLPRALRRGIGLHHGKLPRSLGQFVVRSFNERKIDVLICTSTLIEGVNTKAKNIIIYDNSIAREKLDFFTFNNIKGRSGRMFEHFVGKVYLFHEPPDEELPFVDFPLYTQGANVPDSMLVNMEFEDLTSSSKSRMEPYALQDDLPLEILRKHSSIEPGDLIELAQYLAKLTLSERRLLAWSGIPKWEELKFVCVLAWKYLLAGRTRAGVFSGAQLALKINKLRNARDIKSRILEELIPGQYAAASVDEAVERVLEFDRTWASFEMPRILRAFSDVRKHVNGGIGDYVYFAGALENLFRPSFQVALEEFGLPLQISDKLVHHISGAENLDEALEIIKFISVESVELTPFEIELLTESRAAF